MTDDGPIRGVGANVPQVDGDLDRFDRGLGRLAAAGCAFAELYPPDLDAIVGARLNAGRMRRIEAVCGRHGLRYTVHAPLALNLMDEPNLALHVTVARATLAFCEAVGADIVVIHPGIVPSGAATAAGMDRLFEIERRAFQELAADAEARGVAICIENLEPGAGVVRGERFVYALDPRRLAAQIAAIDRPNVRGTIDFSHAWLAAGHLGFDFAEALRALAPLAGHLHVHDSCGLPPTVEASESDRIAYGQGDLHLPIGWGTIDFEVLLPTLLVRPGATMIIEFEARHWPELEDWVRRAKAYAALVGRSAAGAAPR